MWAEDVISLQASGDINEDKSHKMRSFKTMDCTVKFYSSTKKVITQGSGSACLIKALSDYLESDGSSVTSSSIDNSGDQACRQAWDTKADQDHSYSAAGSNPPINPETY